MNTNGLALKNEEKAIFALRNLYSKYGYSQYKMSKFEEYDLYVKNKDFLISDSVITFTDTNGKLMALKPDVTLSIIKNSKDTPGYVQKVYYNENVYRVSKGTHSFKEIMQVGLECIGELDDYCLYEVLMLAAESLNSISSESVLDISHLGILLSIIDGFGVSQEVHQSIIKCIGEKNIHELVKICDENNISSDKVDMLKNLITIYGTPNEIMPKLESLLKNSSDTKALQQLKGVVSAFEGSSLKDMLRIDFSVVSDINYYNGLVFKGFVNGLPNSILSGGQYDKLMQKMNRKSGAAGFAVYLDMLERLNETNKKYDVDYVLLYDSSANINHLQSTVKELTNNGNSVMLQKSRPEKIRFRQLLIFKDGEVQVLENNA